MKQGVGELGEAPLADEPGETGRRLALPADDKSPAKARRWVRARLPAVPSDVVETCILLVSELVTNAILHAGSDVSVDVTRRPGVVRVDVRDRNTTLPMVTPYGPEATTGRGLRLLDALASTWGIDVTAPGKTIWFEVRDGRLGESPAPTRRAGEGVGQPLSHLADRRGSVPSASLLAMPVARHAAAAAEYDGVVREFRLLGSASSAVGSVAWRLLELIDRLGGSFAAFSGWHRVELRTAAAAGIEVLDLSIDLAPDFVTACRQLDAALDEADAYCASGEHLLTLRPSAEAIAYRKWFIAELVRQADGGDAVSWPESSWAQHLEAHRLEA